jgi:hypothetical protein
VQYIFSCICTHTKLATKLTNNFKEIHKYFRLSKHDKYAIQQIFSSHAKEIKTQAILMEEKRWREMLLSIRYVSTIFKMNHLKKYWEKYLNILLFENPIPPTPLQESIAFLTRLKDYFDSIVDNNSTHRFKKLVIDYELSRNTVFSYQFNANYSNCIKNNGINLYSVEKINLNPSIIIKTFNGEVSKIVEKLKNHECLNRHVAYLLEKTEIVVFFKDRSTGAVKSIQLNELAHFMLIQLTQTSDLASLVEVITNKMNIKKELCVHFMEKLIEKGVIHVS